MVHETELIQQDAFAALREDNGGLLPAHALLPQVDITKTQMARDDAMIAADGDETGEADLSEQPKTQYLNEKGLDPLILVMLANLRLTGSSFFTQTRPVERKESEASRGPLGGSSAVFDPQASADRPAYELSSTQKGTSEAEQYGDDGEISPHRSVTRTRRESLAATEADQMDDEGEEVEHADRAQPVDAFAKLMAAGQRPLTEHQKRAKKLIRSNLVDEQAEESDEDDWMMPGQRSGDEDDNDGDEDGYLAELVDDAAVNEEEKLKQDALAAAKARYAAHFSPVAGPV